jgi:hypothetical protein
MSRINNKEPYLYSYNIIGYDRVEIDSEESLVLNKYNSSFILNDFLYLYREGSVIKYEYLVNYPELKKTLDIYILNNRVKKLNKI